MLSNIVKSAEKLIFKGISLEDSLSVLVVDYGLHDSDIIFIEVKHDSEWVFELDYDNPKYFGPRVVPTESSAEYQHAYNRYWEILNHRSFSTVDSKVFPLPEYSRILQCLQQREAKSEKITESAVAAIEEAVKDENAAIVEEKDQPMQINVIAPNIEEPEILPAAVAEPVVAIQNAVVAQPEVNPEMNGASEANATNETSDGIESNKDLEVHMLSGQVKEEPTGEDCIVQEPIQDILDTKVKLCIANIQLPDSKTATTVRIVCPQKKSTKKSSQSRHDSPIPTVKLHLDNAIKASPSRRSAGKSSGIQNIGNTCYLSSSIQCLKHTNSLLAYISNEDFEATISQTSAGEIIKALGKLLRTLAVGGNCVSPQQFKKTIDKHTDQFPLNKQCDAHEFLAFLIDKMHDETSQKETATIHSTFYGKFKSTIECAECFSASVSLEPFMCISLPIDGAADELNMLLQTKSRHLFYLSCKFDDEGISIGSLKAEIKQQFIVNDLDIYLLSNGNTLELLSDTKLLGSVIAMGNSWELYAIEKDPEELNPDSVLLKLDISKNSIPVLLSFPKSILSNPEEFRLSLKRLVAGPFVQDSELNSSQYNFTFGQQTTCTMASGLSFISMELRVSNRNSHFTDLTSKISHREILILRHTSEDDFGAIEGCLKSFTGKERLHGANQLKCSRCQKLTDAHKKLEYMQLPKVLIIHLKRFKVKCKKSRIKISKLVKFPTYLPLTIADSKTSQSYRLYSVINHVGEIESGHYTAYCRKQSEWELFDDNRVTTLDPTLLETANAYVLFYEQIVGGDSPTIDTHS